MQAVPIAVALFGFILVASGQYYDEELMNDLYKRLSQLDNSYYLEEPWSDEDIQLDDRASQADIRDPEFLQHGAGNNVDGFQYISGNIFNFLLRLMRLVTDMMDRLELL